LPAVLNIATVGDNCIDRFLPPVGRSAVGGNALNVAVQFARRGYRVGYFGAVGEDQDGRRVRDCLAQNGVDLAGLQRLTHAPTAYTDIATASDGERSILREELGACRGYRPSVADYERLVRKRHVHIGWFDDGGILKRRLMTDRVSVSQDLSVNIDKRHAMPDGLSIAFVSAGPSEALAQTLVTKCLAGGARIAVVTCGPLGSRASDGRTSCAVAALRTTVIDTTGAGDSFIAGFLDAHLNGGELTQCLQAGAECAAEACAHFGGFPQELGTL
jgi:fructoselysine 6-kinase